MTGVSWNLSRCQQHWLYSKACESMFIGCVARWFLVMVTVPRSWYQIRRLSEQKNAKRMLLTTRVKLGLVVCANVCIDGSLVSHYADTSSVLIRVTNNQTWKSMGFWDAGNSGGSRCKLGKLLPYWLTVPDWSHFVSLEHDCKRPQTTQWRDCITLFEQHLQ